MTRTTRIGTTINEYLKQHPEEDSPSRIAKETGCDRNTAIAYLKRWRQGRGKSADSAPAERAESAPGEGAENPRDLVQEYPPAPKPKRPAPAPEPDPERHPEPAPVPEDEGVDHVWRF